MLHGVSKMWSSFCLSTWFCTFIVVPPLLHIYSSTFERMQSVSNSVISKKITHKTHKCACCWALFPFVLPSIIASYQILRLCQWLSVSYADSTVFSRIHKIAVLASFCLSLRMEQLSSHWTDCMKFDVWDFFLKIFWELEMFQIKVVEKVKTHILCSIISTENRVVY